MQLLEPASGKAHLCLLLHKPGILCSVLQLLPPTSNHIPSDLSGLTAVGQCWMNQAVLHKAFYLPLFVLCFYLNKKLKCPDMKENILPDLKGIFSSFFFLDKWKRQRFHFFLVQSHFSFNSWDLPMNQKIHCVPLSGLENRARTGAAVGSRAHKLDEKEISRALLC